MSDWSSFDDDKATFGAWREFLNEQEITELEEGFFGDLAAKAGSAASSAMDKAGSAASSAMDKAKQTKLGSKIGQKFSGLSGKGLAKAIGVGLANLILKDFWLMALHGTISTVEIADATKNYLAANYWGEHAKTGIGHLSTSQKQALYRKMVEDSEASIKESKEDETTALEELSRVDAQLNASGVLEGVMTAEEMMAFVEQLAGDTARSPAPVHEAKGMDEVSILDKKMSAAIQQKLLQAARKMQENLAKITAEKDLSEEEVKKLTRMVQLRMKALKAAATHRANQHHTVFVTKRRKQEFTRTPEKERPISFEDLVSLTNLAVQVLLKQVDKDDLILALKGASQGLEDLFLANLSSRAADDIREEMQYLGPVPRSRIRSAQGRIIDAALKLAEDGSIYLPMPEEEEEEESPETEPEETTEEPETEPEEPPEEPEEDMMSSDEDGPLSKIPAEMRKAVLQQWEKDLFDAWRVGRKNVAKWAEKYPSADTVELIDNLFSSEKNLKVFEKQAEKSGLTLDQVRKVLEMKFDKEKEKLASSIDDDERDLNEQKILNHWKLLAGIK